MSGHSSPISDEPVTNGARRIAFAALFNIGFGLVAVSFTVIATRQLGISGASEALVVWSALAVLGAVTQQPAEIYAPRLAFELREETAKGRQLRRAITELVAMGTAVSVCAVLVWGFIAGKSSPWYPGPVVVVIGFGMLYAHRSRLVGVGQFGKLALTAGATGALALLVSLVVVTTGIGDSTSDMLLLASVSFVVPLGVEVMDRRSIDIKPRADGSRARSLPVRPMMTTALSLSGTSAISLLFFAGGPPIASLLGMEPEILTSYAVTTSVASVPFIMMSSAMLPILNRSVELVEQGQWGNLLPTLRAGVGLAGMVVVLVAVASGLLGPFILDVYIGGGFDLDRVEIVAIFIAAGVTAISNAPRLMITALGGAPSFSGWLLVSAGIYVGAIITTPYLGVVWRIVSATILAAGFLTLIGFLSVAQMVHASDQLTREGM